MEELEEAIAEAKVPNHLIPEGGYPFTLLTADETKEAAALSAYIKSAYLMSLPQAEPGLVAKFLHQVIDTFPDEPAPTGKLLVAYATKKITEAEFLGTLKQLSAAHPDSRDLLFFYCVALMETNKLQEAEEVLNRLREDPFYDDNPAVQQLQLDFLVKKGDKQGATKLITTFAASPTLRENFDLQKTVLMALPQLGLDDAAARFWIDLVLKNPSAYASSEALTVITDQLWELKAWWPLLNYIRQFSARCTYKPTTDDKLRVILVNIEAVTQLQDSHEIQLILDGLLAAGSATSNEMLKHLEKKLRAILAESNGANDKAFLSLLIQLTEAMLLRDRSSLLLKRRLVYYYWEDRQWELALAHLGTIQKPSLADQHKQAFLLCLLKRFDEGLAVYANMEARFPNGKGDAEFYFSYGTAAAQAGKPELAIQLLEQALKLSPKSGMIANSLGYTLADFNQDLPRAKALIQQALNEVPNNSAFLDSMAWVLFRQKEFSQALKFMTDAIDNASVWELSALNEEDEINQHLTEILQANGYPRLAEYYRLSP